MSVKRKATTVTGASEADRLGDLQQRRLFAREMPLFSLDEYRKLHEMFMQDKRTSGLSESTLTSYQYHGDALLRFLRLKDYGAISRGALLAWIADMQKRFKKPISVASAYRNLRPFLRWCYFEGVIDHDMTEKVPLPKVAQERKIPLTDEQMDKLFMACETPREQALIILMLDTGLRANEIVHLRLENLDLTARTIHAATTKNRQPRTLPFGSRTAKCLRAYLMQHSGVEWLFYSLHRGFFGQRLTASHLWGQVNNVAVRAGIKAGPHLLRHSFAYAFYKKTKDIMRLKDMLGHGSIAVTDRYINQHFQDLREGYSGNAPMDSVVKRNKVLVRGMRAR